MQRHIGLTVPSARAGRGKKPNGPGPAVAEPGPPKTLDFGKRQSAEGFEQGLVEPVVAGLLHEVRAQAGIDEATADPAGRVVAVVFEPEQLLGGR